MASKNGTHKNIIKVSVTFMVRRYINAAINDIDEIINVSGPW
jgi:hypothetical protein